MFFTCAVPDQAVVTTLEVVSAVAFSSTYSQPVWVFAVTEDTWASVSVGLATVVPVGVTTVPEEPSATITASPVVVALEEVNVDEADPAAAALPPMV
jgi:hypothetical protein